MVSRETFNNKKEILEKSFVAGVISVAGSFTHTSSAKVEQFGFQIKLPANNLALLDEVRKSLGIRNKVKIYKSNKTEYALLVTRSKNEMLKKVIPFCDQNIMGYKLYQFNKWKELFISTN